jgi:hypothetical protein
MDFGSGSTANVSPVQTLPLPISKVKSLKKESYESSIDNRCSTGVGDPGYDPEQPGIWVSINRLARRSKIRSND